MKPAVGDVVHYVSFGTPGGEYASQCRAAIITEVVPLQGEEAAQAEVECWDDDFRCRVGLAVMNPTGTFFRQGAHQDQHSKLSGSWHWPERAE